MEEGREQLGWLQEPSLEERGPGLLRLIHAVPGEEPFPPEAACEGTSPDSRLEASRSLVNNASACVQPRL